MRHPQYTPQELCDAIYEAVVSAGKPISRLEICRLIGRKKSPHILAMIQHLVDQEYLIMSFGTSRQGKPMFNYQIAGNSAGRCAEFTEG